MTLLDREVKRQLNRVSVSSMKRPKILVLGSINMDLVAVTATLPVAGQTVLAQSFAEIAGGKGANQAVAAARAGGLVAMVGRVGSDGFASRLIENLKRENVDCSSIMRTEETPSGLAMIAVAESGENQIVVVPGANGLVTTRDVDRFAQQITDCDMLLVQLEIPMATIRHAIEIANAARVRVVLDPAPAPPADFPDALLNVDLICPNETEAAALTGRQVGSREEIEEAACLLYQRGAKNVAITLGDRGVMLFDGDSMVLIDPIAVDAVDSTAAGDAFVGALAVRWAESGSLKEAARWGNAAGALAAARHGAQPSLASRDEIERCIQRDAASESSNEGDLQR